MNTLNKSMPLSVTAKFLSCRKSSAKGFTLIEVLVAIAILGILTALAIPSFTQSIQRYRVNAARDELIASVELARITAMTQGSNVFIQRNNVCNGVTFVGLDDWSCGWSIFIDTDRNDILNQPTDRLIQTTDAPSGLTIIRNGVATSPTRFVVNRWGQLSDTNNGFTVSAMTNTRPTASNIANHPTSITGISIAGRMRSLKDTLTMP